jgi:hypothetical protein
MKRSTWIGILLLVVSARIVLAQAITPLELQDPKMQHLQQRHLQTLMLIGKEIEEHKFPYPFFLCRTLDVDMAKLQAADLRSIRFDAYQHRTVLAITGNYYASYSAERMDDDKQAAILDAEIYLNGEARSLWLRDGAPPEEWKENNPPRSAAQLQMVAATPVPAATTGNSSYVSNALLKPAPPRIISPESLAGLQRQNQDSIDRMLKAMDSEAHFFPYAPPSFIGFRQSSYLQLSTSTPLEADPTTSRYKLAALAFDEHISHLIRPLLNYFPQDVEFDGVDFSTSIHLPGDGKSEAVEFFFPYRVMRCFASYDCTGQQLLDAGTVIINGERAALDLQVAEGKN